MIVGSFFAAVTGVRPARFPAAEVRIRGDVYGYHPVPANDAVAACASCGRHFGDPEARICRTSGCSFHATNSIPGAQRDHA